MFDSHCMHDFSLFLTEILIDVIFVALDDPYEGYRTCLEGGRV